MSRIDVHFDEMAAINDIDDQFECDLNSPAIVVDTQNMWTNSVESDHFTPNYREVNKNSNRHDVNNSFSTNSGFNIRDYAGSSTVDNMSVNDINYNNNSSNTSAVRMNENRSSCFPPPRDGSSIRNTILSSMASLAHRSPGPMILPSIKSVTGQKHPIQAHKQTHQNQLQSGNSVKSSKKSDTMVPFRNSQKLGLGQPSLLLVAPLPGGATNPCFDCIQFFQEVMEVYTNSGTIMHIITHFPMHIPPPVSVTCSHIMHCTVGLAEDEQPTSHNTDHLLLMDEEGLFSKDWPLQPPHTHDKHTTTASNPMLQQEGLSRGVNMDMFDSLADQQACTFKFPIVTAEILLRMVYLYIHIYIYISCKVSVFIL